MATITGLTAERMLAIEGASIVDGEIIGGNLILTKYDGTTINAGPVAGPQGPPGPMGPAGYSAIPGEVKLWPGSDLPLLADYGKWVWADGAVYVVATYPKAAANISPQWRTFAGASDPGVINFRVPDLRGLVPAGMDSMPGGARANRMTRSVSIVLAGKTGEEIHTITIAETPVHSHVVTDPGHAHTFTGFQGGGTQSMSGWFYSSSASAQGAGGAVSTNGTGITIANAGGGVSHENVQPTVFVPYIVKLDD
jgi:microcystin-dependent protein